MTHWSLLFGSQELFIRALLIGLNFKKRKLVDFLSEEKRGRQHGVSVAVVWTAEPHHVVGRTNFRCS